MEQKLIVELYSFQTLNKRCRCIGRGKWTALKELQVTPAQFVNEGFRYAPFGIKSWESLRDLLCKDGHYDRRITRRERRK